MSSEPHPATLQPSDLKNDHGHPYAKKLEQGLQTQRNMLLLLESKVKLLEQTIGIKTEEYNQKNSPFIELELTEAKISLINTHGQVEAVRTSIKEKEQYYKGYMEQFVKDEEEVNKRYKHTVDIAKKSTKPQVQKLLSMVIWDRIEGDIEAKIALYKQLRKHV